MTYQIEFSKGATKQFKSLSSVIQQRLRPKIDALAEDPLPRGVVKLTGNLDLYRIRVGDYRVIYQVEDDELVVLVVKIGHRGSVYRDLD